MGTCVSQSSIPVSYCVICEACPSVYMVNNDMRPVIITIIICSIFPVEHLKRRFLFVSQSARHITAIEEPFKIVKTQSMAKTGIRFHGLSVSTANPQSSLMSIRLSLPSLLSSFLNQLYLPGFTLQFSSGCQVLKAFMGLTCVAHSSVKSLSTNSEHGVWWLGEAGEKLERQQSSQILFF